MVSTRQEELIQETNDSQQNEGNMNNNSGNQNIGFGTGNNNEVENNEGNMDDFSRYNSNMETKIETEQPENIQVFVYYIPWIERIILPHEELLQCYAESS